jgi:three-Cys-motif partner protein
MEQFLAHPGPLPVPVRVVLIENNRERVARLRSELARLRPRIAASPSIHLDEPNEADASEAIQTILDKHERNNQYGAALFFLDQFGYSAVAMAQVRRILSFRSFEVFALVHYRDLDRFLTDASKAPAMSKLFGGEEWRPAIQLGKAARERFLLPADHSSHDRRAASVLEQHQHAVQLADRLLELRDRVGDEFLGLGQVVGVFE